MVCEACPISTYPSLDHADRLLERGPPVDAGPAPKVIFICPNLKAGGAERQWALLAPGLAERGFDVSVLTLDGRGVYFEDLLARGVPIACAGLRHRADPIGLARAVRLGGAAFLRRPDPWRQCATSSATCLPGDSAQPT